VCEPLCEHKSWSEYRGTTRTFIQIPHKNHRASGAVYACQIKCPIKTPLLGPTRPPACKEESWTPLRLKENGFSALTEYVLVDHNRGFARTVPDSTRKGVTDERACVRCREILFWDQRIYSNIVMGEI
jgi:hypothetical protein